MCLGSFGWRYSPNMLYVGPFVVGRRLVTGVATSRIFNPPAFGREASRGREIAPKFLQSVFSRFRTENGEECAAELCNCGALLEIQRLFPLNDSAAIMLPTLVAARSREHRQQFHEGA